MDQKSNVRYRAEKEYKNSRGKFSFLLREIISNSLHAVLIRKNKDKNIAPEVKLSIQFDDEKKICKIILFDNGEGFTEKNRLYFEELDKINIEKEKLKFHPLGQGRLALLYFSDFSEYETVYKNNDGELKKRIITYPNETIDNSLFSFDFFSEEKTVEKDSFTKLKIEINKSKSFNRAKTFFNKYSDINLFKQWFIETFFPFIVSNEDLSITIELNGISVQIKKDNIESDIENIDFNCLLARDVEYDIEYSFKLWLIKSGKNIGDNPIICFARNLRAELSNGKLTYAIDNEDGYLFYLTSEFFDELVDSRGECIELDDITLNLINSKINEVLDEKFEEIIEKNKILSKNNLRNFKKQYPSLETFISIEEKDVGNNVVTESELIKSAIDEKGKIEKKFWKEKENSVDDSIECQKLINSSLHIYVKHRERVLNQLHRLIQKFDDEGNDKSELESTVHDLFLKKGATLENSNNINHLHNLWILDDKFTAFSKDFSAKSTKTGQALSDIYIWADDPEKTKQILILELKSTTKAHNAGNKVEGMVSQVKRYAQSFYLNPNTVLNWDIDTNNVQYMGIILARKSDINKELSSNNIGNFEKIPFLINSYYIDDKFSINSNNPMERKPIRIELYSYEDIYELANSRNQMFFKLLKKEFELDNEEI